MKVSRMGFEIPDRCPTNCRYLKELEESGYYQGCMCDSCPVLQCALNPIDIKNGFTEEWRMTELNDYREDWAYEFFKYFKDMSYEPKLTLKMSSPMIPIGDLFPLFYQCIGYIFPLLDKIKVDDSYPTFELKYIKVKEELRAFIGDRFLDSEEYELLLGFIHRELGYVPVKE